MPRKKKEVAPEITEEVVETPEVVEEVSPKLKVEKVGVCFDEQGNPTKYVEGIVAKNGKSVTDLNGVTFAL